MSTVERWGDSSSSKTSYRYHTSSSICPDITWGFSPVAQPISSIVTEGSECQRSALSVSWFVNEETSLMHCSRMELQLWGHHSSMCSPQQCWYYDSTGTEEEPQQAFYYPVNWGSARPFAHGMKVRYTFADYFFSPESAMSWQYVYLSVSKLSQE